MITNEQLEILSLFTDDYYSLYEASWFARSHFGFGENESIAFCKAALSSLVEINFIAFYHQNLMNNTTALLTEEELKKVFRQKKLWISQDISKVHIVVGSTEHGRNYYKKHFNK